MASAHQPGNGSTERKARVEEMRHAEHARAHRNRTLTIGAAVAVVAALAVGGVLLLDSQSGSKAAAASDPKARASKASTSVASTSKAPGHFVTGTDGVRTWKGTLSRNHTERAVAYPMEPPVGGDHHPAWLNCNGDVYREQVPSVHAVHSLEHGAVWVTYTSKASKADVDALAAKVRKTP
ncbi:MAG: DUF3105 domain-containing protein, partial [Streptomyces sp.]|nr:DUF3105 domain-containing protein [Streptomyces sp.]